MSRRPNVQGIVKARTALELMRVGSDSGPETLFRMAMHDANLPEPQLQLNLYYRDVSPSADLGYKSKRIAIQYDGAHHLDVHQQISDHRRDKQFVNAGWTVLVFDSKDLADAFSQAIVRIKLALDSCWVNSAIQAGFQK